MLLLAAPGGPARAGGFTACDSPFVFETAAANIVPIEYLATTADQDQADRRATLQETAQRLAWLIKLDSWHQATYGSLGVVAHMFLGRQCDPDETVETLLSYGGGGAPVRPGQILLIVQGKIFIDGEQIFLQTRLRGLRRNDEARREGEPLARAMAPEGIRAALPIAGQDIGAALPDLDVTFAPRALTTAEFAEIDRIFAQASRLHSEPSQSAPGEDLGFVADETRAFRIEILGDGAWLRVEDMLSGQSGYIHSDPEASRFLHARMPELDFLNAMLGYLRIRQAGAVSGEFPAPPPGSADLARQSLQAFVDSDRASDEPEARALAFALMAALQIESRGSWDSARRDLVRAVELAPYKSEYRNMLGVIDTQLCCAGSSGGDYGDPAPEFADALSLAPGNTEALTNLNAFLTLLDDLSPPPPGIDASRLDDRRQVVQRVLSSTVDRAP